jgi:hypothetical protein
MDPMDSYQMAGINPPRDGISISGHFEEPSGLMPSMTVKKNEKVVRSMQGVSLHLFFNLDPLLLGEVLLFMGSAGMLGDLVLKIVYIVRLCLKGAIETDILALERYHGTSEEVESAL